MLKAFTVLVLLMVTAGFAAADMYKWVDDKGTVNFTEDYAKIPKKYRKKVKVKREAVENTPEPVAANGEELKKDAPAKSNDASRETAAVTKGEKKKSTYGGKSEEEWKADFKKLNDNINSVQAQIDERKARLDNPSTLSRARYRGIEIEIKELEEKLAQLQGKLNTLDESATRAGVPYEVRN